MKASEASTTSERTEMQGGTLPALAAAHALRPEEAAKALASDLVTGAGQALVVQAGTATSTRLRDEEQSFNLIEVDANHAVTVAVQAWDGTGFASANEQGFSRVDGTWQTEAGEQLAEADA